MLYTPEIPKFEWSKSRDGKRRLYLIASNPTDIELMIHLCGCLQEGIRQQKDKNCDLWFRIIKKYEEPLINKVFEIS